MSDYDDILARHLSEVSEEERRQREQQQADEQALAAKTNAALGDLSQSVAPEFNDIRRALAAEGITADVYAPESGKGDAGQTIELKYPTGRAGIANVDNVTIKVRAGAGAFAITVAGGKAARAAGQSTANKQEIAGALRTAYDQALRRYLGR